jgi:hypothetical protein
VHRSGTTPPGSGGSTAAQTGATVSNSWGCKGDPALCLAYHDLGDRAFDSSNPDPVQAQAQAKVTRDQFYNDNPQLITPLPGQSQSIQQIADQYSPSDQIDEAVQKGLLGHAVDASSDVTSESAAGTGMPTPTQSVQQGTSTADAGSEPGRPGMPGMPPSQSTDSSSSSTAPVGSVNGSSEAGTAAPNTAPRSIASDGSPSGSAPAYQSDPEIIKTVDQSLQNFPLTLTSLPNTLSPMIGHTGLMSQQGTAPDPIVGSWVITGNSGGCDYVEGISGIGYGFNVVRGGMNTFLNSRERTPASDRPNLRPPPPGQKEILIPETLRRLAGRTQQWQTRSTENVRLMTTAQRSKFTNFRNDSRDISPLRRAATICWGHKARPCRPRVNPSVTE